MKTKAIVNGEVVSRDELNQLFLNRLDITPFRFLQRDPYGSRAWPTLGWRGLVLHMYRRQRCGAN